jgi:FKBP-type peptidyl-prolyl cis-trans isomerase FkpA/FKBP-type peptidyl-prolyl cis-trans isomerase FklB
MSAHRALALVLVLAGTIPARASGPAPETDEQKTLYALGLTLSRNLTPFNLTAAELAFVQAGLADGITGAEPKVDARAFTPKIQEFARARAAAAAETEKKAAEGFLAKAAKEKGAVRTASRLIVVETTPGKGASPSASDRVKVHYHGTLIDGTVFDSSVERGEPATFPLNGVIRCWTEGLQTMKVGGKSRLICPPDIAYGDRGAPPKIKPGATLVFDVELLEILDQAKK